MKGSLPIAIFLLAICPLTFARNDLEHAKQEFTRLRDELAGAKRKSDILFLLDTSGISAYGFNAEKNFVKRFLDMITVSFGAARVEVIPFGKKASRYIDGVSSPSLLKHKCHLDDGLKRMPQRFDNGRTNTKDAFKLACDVCLGVLSAHKRGGYDVKTVVILITRKLWNFPWYDSNPVPNAQRLYNSGRVEVFAIGVGGWISMFFLRDLVKNPANQAFHLQNFQQLQELSVYIRGDPIDSPGGSTYQPAHSHNCHNMCDLKARCVCDALFGTHRCLCLEGYVGSGHIGKCRKTAGKKTK